MEQTAETVKGYVNRLKENPLLAAGALVVVILLILLLWRAFQRPVQVTVKTGSGFRAARSIPARSNALYVRDDSSWNLGGVQPSRTFYAARRAHPTDKLRNQRWDEHSEENLMVNARGGTGSDWSAISAALGPHATESEVLEARKQQLEGVSLMLPASAHQRVGNITQKSRENRDRVMRTHYPCMEWGGHTMGCGTYGQG